MRVNSLAPLIAFAFALAGCGTQPIPKSDAHLRQAEAAKAPAAPAIPPAVRGVPMPPPPEARAAELRYSVVVANQPVRDVLLAMARETQINFDIHPGIEGTITLNAIDQTLKQILTRISKQVDLRWEAEGVTISVMPDSPYLKSYRVNYVNMARDVTETVGIATQVISGTITNTSGGGGSSTSTAGSGDNNSTLRITNSSRHRFWETLERNIKDMLRETDKLLPEGSSETFIAGRAQSAAATTQQTTAARRAAAAAATTTPGESVSQQASETVERRLTFREAASVIVNPESGIVSIRATSRQHEKVAEFLEQVGGSANRQVVIEATVVEVLLNDKYQSGVDWSALAIDGLGYSFRQSFSGANVTETPFFSLAYSNPSAAIGGNISSTVKLLNTFGTTRVLSSPKLMALNNQTAVLKVVDNEVYFTVQANTTQNQTQSVTTFTTTQNVVPVGLIMNVTPQISEGDMVTVNIRPTVTSILRTVIDPNPSLAAARVESRIPVTQTREMESVLRVGSGQTAILGGLMIDSFVGSRDGLPIAARIPIFGDLFSYRQDAAIKRELVIFLRPVVIKDASIDTDLSAYRRYLPDREFFKDTETPFPEFQEGLRQLQRGDTTPLTPVPVVPDPPAPATRP